MEKNNRPKRIAILTSGGDAPGMNAAIRAVVRSALYYDMEVYGIRDGYLGLKRDEVEKLDAGSVGDIIHRGGTFLGTARLPEFATSREVREGCYDTLRRYGIEGLWFAAATVPTGARAWCKRRATSPPSACPAPSTTTWATPTSPSALTQP